MNVARLQLASSGLLAVIGTMPAIALAWTTACTDMKAETLPLAMPASISVPRDLPDGSSISAWIYAPDSPFWASCTTRESSAGIGYEPRPPSPSAIPERMAKLRLNKGLCSCVR